ncbi:MAG: MBL fold metallo-hydrolase [Clostridium sp.]
MKLNKLTNTIYYSDYVSEGDRPVLGIVIGKEGCLLIDSGNSKSHINEFIEQVNKITNLPIEVAIITHWHWDHVFGLHWLSKIYSLTSICSRLTYEKIEYLTTLKWDKESLEDRVTSGEEIEFCREHMMIELSDLDEVVVDKPTMYFDDNIDINLNGIKCSAINIGGDHSKDSTIILVEDTQKVVFLGDCLYLDMYNGRWSYSMDKLYPMLQTLRSLNADYYIPSHHDMYTRDEFIDYTDYIIGIGKCVKDKSDIQESIKGYETLIGRKAKSNEIYDIECFVYGNIKKTFI